MNDTEFATQKTSRKCRVNEKNKKLYLTVTDFEEQYFNNEH